MDKKTVITAVVCLIAGAAFASKISAIPGVGKITSIV